MADFNFGNFELSRRQRRITAAMSFVAIGMGMGALAALFVAPKSGKQLRKDVRRKYEDARDVVENITDRANNIWERREAWAEPVTRAFRRRA